MRKCRVRSRKIGSRKVLKPWCCKWLDFMVTLDLNLKVWFTLGSWGTSVPQSDVSRLCDRELHQPRRLSYLQPLPWIKRETSFLLLWLHIDCKIYRYSPRNEESLDCRVCDNTFQIYWSCSSLMQGLKAACSYASNARYWQRFSLSIYIYTRQRKMSIRPL